MRGIESSIFVGTLSIGIRLRMAMGQREFDFAPLKITRGGDVHVLTGTQGEVVKIDQSGKLLGSVTIPFPAPILDSVIIDNHWIGVWLDREFRQARMASLPIDLEWRDGASREMLRSSINSPAKNEVLPSNSLWHRVLDSEPMKIGVCEGNIVFATISGIYMIDTDANEIWRGLLPRWPKISSISAYDSIVGVTGFSEGLAIWSKGGGVSVLDPSNGLEIYSRVIDFGDSVSNVIFSEEGGWFVMLHEGSFSVMEKIESSHNSFRTKGPILDADFSCGSWNWTGWRQDGSLTGSSVRISDRDNVGVSIIGNRVILANDGSWSEFRH